MVQESQAATDLQLPNLYRLVTHEFSADPGNPEWKDRVEVVVEEAKSGGSASDVREILPKR